MASRIKMFKVNLEYGYGGPHCSTQEITPTKAAVRVACGFFKVPCDQTAPAPYHPYAIVPASRSSL